MTAVDRNDYQFVAVLDYPCSWTVEHINRLDFSGRRSIICLFPDSRTAGARSRVYIEKNDSKKKNLTKVLFLFSKLYIEPCNQKETVG